MKTTVSEYDFRRAFEQIRPDNFTYEGLGAMFDYFEQHEDSCGEEIELDVIAICCEFSEYDIGELNNQFPNIAEEIECTGDSDDINDWMDSELRDNTSLIKVNESSLIMQDY